MSRGFFRMPPREAATLVFLVCFSVVSFLPRWRTVEVAGMALFGWLMAALMLVSPAVTLLAFCARRRRRH